MKSVLQHVFEASGKPSDIKKYVQKDEKKKVRFKSGDIYDTTDSGYYDDFSYYSAKGHGYIKDKEGNTYDVEVMTSQGDAGRIAGGSTNYTTIIKKANGKDDFVVNGYVAIMSTPVNDKCIADIRAGYYLEDYIAKYIRDNHDKSFQEIAAKGDKNAKSYDDNKEEKKADKYREFMTRYFRIPNNIGWKIGDEGLEIIKGWYPGEKSPETKEMREKAAAEWHKNNASDLYKKLEAEASENSKKIDQIVFDIVKPIVTNMISKVFKTKDINKLKGFSGKIVYDTGWGEIAKGVSGDQVFAVDTKGKKIVKAIWAINSAKIIDHDLEIRIADNIGIDKSLLTSEAEQLIRTVAKAWKKANGGKQGEYIEKNWERIQREGGGYWKWNKTASQAKAEAKAEYKNLIEKHDFDKNDKLEFSLALIQLYIKGDLDPEEGAVEKPLENPEPSGEKKERGKDTKMSAGANKAAYDKMKAWHEGTRKQNVANCSDAKLKMNYKVCKELGFDKEMDILKKEADKRGIVLESISLLEMVLANTELDNE